MINACVFPGLGYFWIGMKLRGTLIVVATCYFLIMPLMRFTHSLFMLTLPQQPAPLAHQIMKALPLAWKANYQLILWSLLGIVTLWLIGVIDIWTKLKSCHRENPERSRRGRGDHSSQ